MSGRKLVRRVRRKVMGARVEARIYDTGRIRLRVDHPSNSPAVEFAIGGLLAEMLMAIGRENGLEYEIAPVKWRDDPGPPSVTTR